MCIRDRAIAGLSVQPELLLNDAVTIPGVEIQQIPIVKGDAKSVSIAAASIMAKVTRDHMMDEYDALFPEYGFKKHKGYGTFLLYTSFQQHPGTVGHGCSDAAVSVQIFHRRMIYGF